MCYVHNLLSVEIGVRDMLQANAILLTGIMIMLALSPGDVSGSDAQSNLYLMKQILGYSTMFFIVSIGISFWPTTKVGLFYSKMLFLFGLGSVFLALVHATNF